ncbi:MAG: T9SS type A sorting domain-containing protein [Bacteroidetes bacterium]|nr:T9SS type A sorting domain-containing protein [Bacteroidota bacterium]
MKSLYLKRKIESVSAKYKLIKIFIGMFIFSVVVHVSSSSAQAVLFDFDNAPLYTPLPITQAAGGITANFTATGQGFSIQDANVLGFTPAGFSGHIIYPNSVYLADLLIGFDQPITDFSIMYTCQELGCDDAATMRVTAYMNGNLVGTNTKTASIPGTWPVDTLSCSFAQGFNSVVVHYDSPPPTCQDYGVIFMADNMRVTALNSGINNPDFYLSGLKITNPVSQSATISFSLLQSENITVAVYDNAGRLIKNLLNGASREGEHQIHWNVNDDAINPGLYFLKLTGEDFFRSCKFVVVK